MNHRSRQDDLQTLGLVDWTIRPDGALRARPAAAPVPADQDSLAQPSRSADTPVPELGSQSDSLDEPAGSAVKPAPEGVPVEAVDEPPTDDELAGMDWSTLEAYLAQQDHRGATRPVFGIGARDADVLIVGEAPGANEDAEGMPFVGRAGKLLDRMLFAIGCSRDSNVYITNICKFRPPDNRDPTPEEVAEDWPILERQIDLMAPKLVVAVGRIAAQTLLDSKEPLGKMRGRMHAYPRRELDVLVTYHPAYLLRSPQQKVKAWDDLRIIARHIGRFAA